ncbi:uncharacterized protein LODBEIA_P56840 [Lodderomyces beijingensis]|uniref:Poly(A) polymerase n=1 Tax=Lodderomyces beijingensis TaxID=1775926 RepID=A0ABP0ZQK0_9ASCO
MASLGVTPPISLDPPTPEDVQANDLLIKELKSRSSFETETATKKRAAVLTELQALANRFSPHGSKLFTFGSYRLGVYSPDSDIDALLVFPKNITRDHFFTEFPKILKDNSFSEIVPVVDAFVPVIKMKKNVSIDLLFARLSVPKITSSLVLSDEVLKTADASDMRALNGTRVTDEILQLVPKPQSFKYALRLIKIWAMERGIYGNVYGYPGGVAWAMLVARVCQLYPNAVAATIVSKFFQIFSQWAWPQPVLLKPILSGPLRVWNPLLYPGDRLHRMPVITPAYPSMCATHNITKSTMAVILEELERGRSLGLPELLARHDFFHRFRFYLCIAVASKGEELHFHGWCESKIRFLVGKLEVVPGVQLARPFPRSFEQRVATAEALQECGTTTGDSLEAGEYCVSLYYIGLVLSEKVLDISSGCADFFSVCKGWPEYKPGEHFVSIRTVKLAQLSAAVYPQGEVRPRKRKRREAGGDKKRAKSVET